MLYSFFLGLAKLVLFAIFLFPSLALEFALFLGFPEKVYEEITFIEALWDWFKEWGHK